MIRLHIIAEGQTEKAFADKILAPYLAQSQVFVDARCVYTGRDRHSGKVYRGGLSLYRKAKDDLISWMAEDKDPACRFTTMFDLYALPRDFPGYEASKALPAYDRVAALERALAADIEDPRFIPYLQLHEFEALILADPSKLDWEYLEHKRAIQNLVKMVADQNPEEINNGLSTAPSKRILKEIPEYNKVTSAYSVIEQIGLATFRQKCRHFAEWLSALENLAQPSP